MIILIEIYKKQSNLSNLMAKHNKLKLIISQYNNSLFSYFLPNIDNIQNFNIKSLIIHLNNIKIYNINKNNFQEIIYIIEKILFNDEIEDEKYPYGFLRSRTLYQIDNDDEMNININIDSHLNNHHSYKSHNFNNFIESYQLNDSFSHFSHNTISYNKSNINNPQNQYYKLNNIELLSERVHLPINDNITNNYSDLKKSMGIVSNSGSYNLNSKIKI